MSCCGNARRALASIATPAKPRSDSGPPRRFAVEFEYVGATALVVSGGATGRHYRFEHSGARVAVDPRDRPSLARVPKLREVI